MFPIYINKIILLIYDASYVDDLAQHVYLHGKFMEDWIIVSGESIYQLYSPVTRVTTVSVRGSYFPFRVKSY